MNAEGARRQRGAVQRGRLLFYVLGSESFLSLAVSCVPVSACTLGRSEGSASEWRCRVGRVTGRPGKEGMALTLRFLPSWEMGQRGSCGSSRPRWSPWSASSGPERSLNPQPPSSHLECCYHSDSACPAGLWREWQEMESVESPVRTQGLWVLAFRPTELLLS